jgi:hypothetical protein
LSSSDFMASAKAGVHVVQLKPIIVPDILKDGYKFVKWDDVSMHSPRDSLSPQQQSKERGIEDNTR